VGLLLVVVMQQLAAAQLMCHLESHNCTQSACAKLWLEQNSCTIVA
jgi:hypothetical protein